ncbi:MAG: amino acid permease [Candidatus Thorarchaeota archaeon]|nr:MAG: amino acid permease [Candidatus Thorarchaeota archaeon]
MVVTPDDAHGDERFDRRLGLVGALSIGLGAMLGGGIYVIAGTAAGMIGPALVMAYLATGLLTIFTAINYAELACSIPKQGGGYTFAQDTIGGFPAFLTGWFLFIGNIVACGLYALAVAHTIGVFIPEASPQILGLIAIGIIIVTFITNYASLKGVTGVLGILNVIQSIILFSFIAVGFFFVKPENISLVHPELGLFTFMSTVSFIYISFVGFELITTASEEIKEPARNIPRAIMLTLLIATLIYMAAALVLVGVTPYTEIADSHTPISVVYEIMLGPGAFYLALAGMAASNYAALNATFLATARIAYSMGRDRYFPTILESVSKKRKTPIPALILTLILVSLFASSGNVDLVAHLSDFGYLIGLSIVNYSVIVLRRKGLSVPGTFKGPFFPIVPILGIITCLMLVPTLNISALQLGGILTVAGLVVFLLYGWNRNRDYVDGLEEQLLEKQNLDIGKSITHQE